MEEKAKALLDQISAFFPVDLDLVTTDLVATDYDVVLQSMENISRDEKQELLRIVVSALSERLCRSDLHLRIALVRVLVALLPISLNAIEAFLLRSEEAADYELHFTMFCHLDWSELIPDGAPDQILSFTRQYLNNAKTNTAYATWMAGHMLADHWSVEEAMPVLLEASLSARFVAGRRSSALALEELGKRLIDEDEPKKVHQLAMRLRSIATTDKSRHVRDSALFAAKSLSEARKKSKEASSRRKEAE